MFIFSHHLLPINIPLLGLCFLSLCHRNTNNVQACRQNCWQPRLSRLSINRIPRIRFRKCPCSASSACSRSLNIEPSTLYFSGKYSIILGFNLILRSPSALDSRLSNYSKSLSSDRQPPNIMNMTYHAKNRPHRRPVPFRPFLLQTNRKRSYK